MRVMYSIMMDWQEKFFNQAVVFLKTLLATGVSRDQIVVHSVRRAEFSAETIGKMFKVPVVFVNSYIDLGLCNKLQQLPLLATMDCDTVMLCDVDLAFAGNPEKVIQPGRVMGRAVDLNMTPIPELERLAKAFWFDKKPLYWRTICENAETWRGNVNGGVYILPKEILKDLYRVWSGFARKIAGSRDILGGRVVFAEQLGFCFALMEMGIDVMELPVEYNFPVIHQRVVWRYGEPVVLHYHELGKDGLVKEYGEPVVDRVIARVNGVIRKSEKEVPMAEG